jgi:hypothetical protein
MLALIALSSLDKFLSQSLPKSEVKSLLTELHFLEHSGVPAA